MKNGLRFVVCVCVVGSLIGCSSAPPTATETPTAGSVKPVPFNPKAIPSDPSAQKPPSQEEKASEASPAAPTDAPTREEGLRKASRPPTELITNPTVLYVFNFKESEVGKAAQEQCQASSGGAADAMAACLQKARGKVPVESVRFKKKGAEYWWVTLNRYKGNLLKWHIIQFQIGEEQGDRVTLKPFGKDKGIAPMAKIPAKLEIALPNDYSIVIDDPEFGKMTFDAKIGAIEND